MNYFLEPYAEFINLALPFSLFIACLGYIALHIHLITRVTPRVDKLNGFNTSHYFKINHHQSNLYQRCFSGANVGMKKMFKVEKLDRLFFRCDKILARTMIIVLPLGFSLLGYTHTLVL